MATLSQVGIAGVGNGMLHPKLKHKWRVTFAGMGGSGVDSKDLSLQAVNVTRPNLSFEEVPIHRYNSVAYVLGKHSFEPITLTVEDDITGRAGKVVQAQLEMQQKLIGADGAWLASAATASAYKFGTILELLDGNEQVVETWRVEGCMLTAVDFGDLDYSASESATITMTVRFDHARQELGGESLGTALNGFL